MMGIEIYGGEEPLMIQSATSCVKHGGGKFMKQTFMAAKETGSLMLIDDATADRSSKKNSEVYRTNSMLTLNKMFHKLIGR